MAVLHVSNSSMVGLKMRQPGLKMEPRLQIFNDIKYLFCKMPHPCKYLTDLKVSMVNLRLRTNVFRNLARILITAVMLVPPDAKHAFTGRT